MKIIILCTSKYKDNDAIITAASETGVVVFRVYGLFREKCQKRAFLRNPLTVADVIFTNQNQHYEVLKEASLCDESVALETNAKLLTAMSLIASLAFAVSEDTDYVGLYNDLLKPLSALKHGKDPLLTAMTFSSQVFRKTGYDWEINHCVRCGTKHSIVAFSFIEGGFICRECFDKNIDKLSLSPTELKLLRDIYGHDEYDFHIYEHESNDVLHLFDIFIEYISDNYSISIANDLLK